MTMYDELSARNTCNVTIPFQYGETRPVFDTLPLYGTKLSASEDYSVIYDTLPLYDTTPSASDDYSIISQYDSFMMPPVASLGQTLYGEATRSNEISNAITFNMKYDTS